MFGLSAFDISVRFDFHKHFKDSYHVRFTRYSFLFVNIRGCKNKLRIDELSGKDKIDRQRMQAEIEYGSKRKSHIQADGL